VKPFLVAPAMNTAMFLHPLTSEQLQRLEALGIVVIPPIAKLLACGDMGVGAMEDATAIARIAKEALNNTADNIRVEK
jgi:phosphopantothenoylcysteine decarboxylase